MKTINCRGTLLEFDTPKVMGILNYTPDSFSDGGLYNSVPKALNQINNMLKDGADIIDIGAISSRPGSKSINTSEEKARLKPLLIEILKQFPNQVFSLDTYRSEIAEWAVQEYNISIINDISAGELDNNMFSTIAKLQVPYIIMHMQGKPSDMQNNPTYNNVTQEIIQYFSKKIDILKTLGVHDVIIDPGFGFGKTVEHNYQIIKELEAFNIFENLLLVGLSRKSMIQKVLNTKATESLNGTTILNTIALEKGAKILRVHDVKEAKEIIKIHSLIS